MFYVYIIICVCEESLLPYDRYNIDVFTKTITVVLFISLNTNILTPQERIYINALKCTQPIIHTRTRTPIFTNVLLTPWDARIVLKVLADFLSIPLELMGRRCHQENSPMEHRSDPAATSLEEGILKKITRV